MSRNLLYKTSRQYLLYSILILLVAAPLFYYVTQQIYIEEADDTLALHKKEFQQYTAPSLHDTDIILWNKFNRNANIEQGNRVIEDSFFYSTYYDTLDAEQEPYRELMSTVTIKGKPFIYRAKVNLVESEDLLKSISILFFVLIFVLLLGLFFINRKLSLTLWKPFYTALQEIENFQIDKNKKPEFIQTDITEFNRLHASINKLVEKNITIYANQREFVENAAHELQTPLAIFQAKIDMLIQRNDITMEQSEILTTLNDSVARLARLNKNLLLLSKMENTGYGERQLCNINEALEKNLSFFTEQATAKQIAITIQHDAVLEVQANTALVDILLNNLFLNAIRHNHLNGTIQVITSATTLVFINSGEPVSLDREKLFNRFYKADASAYGNGLGLSIIKKITDLHNWTVDYRYADGLHRFTITC